MKVVRALSEIGPRPACSEAEERAAQWCADHLAELGYAVAIEAFAARASADASHARHAAAATAGALAVGALPLVGFVIGVITIVLYARDVEGRPLIRPTSARSHNVVARTAGAPQLVVCAHLDSGARRGSAGPERVRLVAFHCALVLTPLLGAVGWVAGDGTLVADLLWLPALAAGAALGLVALFHVRTARSPASSVYDNTGGVEMVMRLAALHPAGVWFVLTGAKKPGMFGIQAFVERHASVASARFLNFDSVDAGFVAAAWEEGVLRPHAADRELLAAAEENGLDSAAFRAAWTDATALSARRLKAVSLVGRGSAEEPDARELDRLEIAARRIVASAVGIGAPR